MIQVEEDSGKELLILLDVFGGAIIAKITGFTAEGNHLWETKFPFFQTKK